MNKIATEHMKKTKEITEKIDIILTWKEINMDVRERLTEIHNDIVLLSVNTCGKLNK